MSEVNEVQGETEALPAKGKSIIDPKYRGKYKTPDWLGTFMAGQVTNTKTLPATPATEATEQVGEIGKEGFKPAKAAKAAQPERVVADGVDVEKVFALGRKNGLNLDKFETQKDGHGFEGRFRMTVRNMLQTVAKQRHGLYNLGDTFVEAPADWLALKSAPANATHNQDGSKIAVAKVVKAEETASKLIPATEEVAGTPKTVVKKKK